MPFQKEKVTIRDAHNSCVLIGTIFNEIKRAGQLKSCFPYEKEMHQKDNFVEIMKNDNHLFAVYYKSLLCGAVWLNSWEFRTARVTYAAFKTTARLHFYDIMKEAARQLINIKDSNGEYCVDSLYGLVEEQNKKSVRAARLSGFRKTGFIPDFYGRGKSVLIFAMTRD